MSLCGDLEIFGEGNCGTYSKSCRVGKIFGQQRLQFVVQIQNKKNVILGKFWSHIFLTMKFVLGICCTYTKICRLGRFLGFKSDRNSFFRFKTKHSFGGDFGAIFFDQR